jgi:hypothetical protein
MIQVHNKHTYKGEGHYIGRPSALGNPYTHLYSDRDDVTIVESRDKAVSMYKEWLEEAYDDDIFVHDEINFLVKEYLKKKELHLICWCKPQACHGDVIKEFLEKIIGEHNE